MGKKKMKYICTKCGSLLKYQGSAPVGFLEIFIQGLVILFIICCLVYDLIWVKCFGSLLLITWFFNFLLEKNHCSVCKCNNCVIPIDSPIGKEISEKYINKEVEI